MYVNVNVNVSGFPACWELVRAAMRLLLPLYIPACRDDSSPSGSGPVGGGWASRRWTEDSGGLRTARPGHLPVLEWVLQSTSHRKVRTCGVFTDVLVSTRGTVTTGY